MKLHHVDQPTCVASRLGSFLEMIPAFVMFLANPKKVVSLS